MNTEQILDLWEQDNQIDELNLVGEALRSPKLHGKYYRIFVAEKQRALELAAIVKITKLRKSEFYTMGPDSDTPESWKLPDFGRVAKAEVSKYLEADQDIIRIETKYQMQVEKVKLVESIINSLRDRGYAIRNAIDMIKFQQGA
jgi:hypothetical protein